MDLNSSPLCLSNRRSWIVHRCCWNKHINWNGCKLRRRKIYQSCRIQWKVLKKWYRSNQIGQRYQIHQTNSTCGIISWIRSRWKRISFKWMGINIKHGKLHTNPLNSKFKCGLNLRHGGPVIYSNLFIYYHLISNNANLS